MFDVGFWELALIGVVALIIVGPERLPGVVRTAGRWAGQARRIVREAKADLEREMKAHDIEPLQDLKREVQHAGKEFKRAAGDIDATVGAAKPGKFGDALRETPRQAEPGPAGDGAGSATVNSAATVNATAAAGDSVADADSTVTEAGADSTVTEAAADAIATLAAGAGDHYIYESRGRAVLHAARCTYCDHGRGRAGRGAGQGARWHGPYSNRAAAERAQQALGARLKKVCGCVGRPAAESTGDATAASTSTVTSKNSTATVGAAKPPRTVAAASTAAESP